MLPNRNNVHPMLPNPNNVHLMLPNPNNVHPMLPNPNIVHPMLPNPNNVHPMLPNSNNVHLMLPNPNNVHPMLPNPNNVHPILPNPNSVHLIFQTLFVGSPLLNENPVEMRLSSVIYLFPLLSKKIGKLGEEMIFFAWGASTKANQSKAKQSSRGRCKRRSAFIL